MPISFNIEESGEKVVVGVTEPGSYGRVALSILFGTGFGYLFIRLATSGIFQAVVGIFIAIAIIREVISSLRGTNVQLYIGKLDLMSRGHAPGGYSPSTISRATIERFEYRKAIGGGNGPDYPEGLYAEWSSLGSWPSSQCILPGVNQAQADAVIEAIYKCFPDTGTLSTNKSRKSDLISLNLNATE